VVEKKKKNHKWPLQHAAALDVDQQPAPPAVAMPSSTSGGGRRAPAYSRQMAARRGPNATAARTADVSHQPATAHDGTALGGTSSNANGVV